MRGTSCHHYNVLAHSWLDRVVGFAPCGWPGCGGEGPTSELLVREGRVLVQGSLDWCRCYGALGRRAAALREICILAPSATLETQHKRVRQARNNSGAQL